MKFKRKKLTLNVVLVRLRASFKKMQRHIECNSEAGEVLWPHLLDTYATIGLLEKFAKEPSENLALELDEFDDDSQDEA